MSVALFNAGLGDIIRTCYLTASYQAISEAQTPLPVIVASHNPFSLEIFRHHRNAGNFILYDLGHKFQEFIYAGLRGAELNDELCRFAGVDPASIIRGRPDGHVPVFDAPDDLESEGHIVFQPFAGAMPTRALPAALIAQMAEMLRGLPWPTYILTRSYPRTGVGRKNIHAVEDAHALAGGSVKVLDHLSVPATLNLVKSCRAYVGSWSSLQQAAWLENKPVAVYYPKNHIDVRENTAYAFGMGRENTLGREFPQADVAELEAFLRRW